MATLRIIVGSTNRAKLSAAQVAFARAFAPLQLAVAVEGVNAPSGVPDQPMGDVETRRGAFNRAYQAANVWMNSHPHQLADFSVGMEGGCDDSDIELPSGALEVGSGAPAPVATFRDLSCFAWMAILHIPTGRWGFARTGSFSLPPAVAALVRSGVELGEADDRVFGRSGSKQSEGAVGILTHGAITRATYYEHALHLALVPLLHDAPFASTSGAGAGAVPAPQGPAGAGVEAGSHNGLSLHMPNPRGNRDEAEKGMLKTAPTGLYVGHAQLPGPLR